MGRRERKEDGRRRGEWVEGVEVEGRREFLKWEGGVRGDLREENGIVFIFEFYFSYLNFDLYF